MNTLTNITLSLKHLFHECNIRSLFSRDAIVRLVFVAMFLLSSLATGHIAQAGTSTPAQPDPPEGVSDGDWATMQELTRHVDYYPTWNQNSAAYAAPNWAQGWRMAFGADGTQITPSANPELAEGWEWGLTLTGYGYEGHLQALSSQPDIIVDDNRVVYQWDDNLTEWYVNDERGLEQGFTIAAPPPGADGLLQLEMAYGGDLTLRLADNPSTGRRSFGPGTKGSGQAYGVRLAINRG